MRNDSFRPEEYRSPWLPLVERRRPLERENPFWVTHWMIHENAFNEPVENTYWQSVEARRSFPNMWLLQLNEIYPPR